MPEKLSQYDVPTNDKSEKKLKLFGTEAQRVNKEEYFAVAKEVLGKLSQLFEETAIITPLEDKIDNGDIDIICICNEKLEKKIFNDLLRNQLKDYSHNSGIFSLLIESSEINKKVHVDIIKTKDREEFERRKIFLSKGHLSAAIGILAKGLNFKYAQEGFFKRYKDSKGQWHSIHLTGDLKKGLEVLGFDPKEWEKVKNINDIINFLKNSPFFTSWAFETSQLTGKRKDGYKRVPQQRRLFERLASLNIDAKEIDQNKFLKKLYTKWYKKYQDEVEKIEKELKFEKAIDGNLIMKTFNLKPGPNVGKIIKYLKEKHPDINDIDPEIKKEIIESFNLDQRNL